MVRVGAHAPKIGKGTVVVQGSLEWTVPTPHPKPRDAFLLRRCAEACPTTCQPGPCGATACRGTSAVLEHLHVVCLQAIRIQCLRAGERRDGHHAAQPT
jgi:hypothetical protein